MQAPILSEQYRIVNLLGAGGAGEVYLVENLVAKRLEALKVLKAVATEDGERVARGRFKREVTATSWLLAHHNIVQTYEYGRLADGRLYLTMEYAAGSSLAALLHQRGPFSIGKTLGIVAEIADALDHAHAAGVIHRDIKPLNVILADHPDGSIVRVLDFGMAKILDATIKESIQLSNAGTAFGTPTCMAPEQWKGLPPDSRSDLYALGCLAYELLVGNPPFHGTFAQIMHGHITKVAPAPSLADPAADIPPALDALVLRCLEKDVDRRFQTGHEVATAARAVPGYRPLRAPTS